MQGAVCLSVIHLDLGLQSEAAGFSKGLGFRV